MSGARKTFTFNGVNSSTYNLWINGAGVYNSAEPDLEYVPIPGRNGDLIYDNNRFHNVEIAYSPVFAPSSFRQNFMDFKAWLLSLRGYYRLRDDYNTDYYRMASVNQAMIVNLIDWPNDAGQFDLIFNCKPQLYLLSGDSYTMYYDSDSPITLNNPTKFNALPILRVWGTGTVTVGDVSFNILDNPYASDSGVYIDSEAQECYNDSTQLNLNQYVEIEDFPYLKPGNNTITLGEGIDMIDIKPRWWTI